jgi:hypothetical protein
VTARNSINGFTYTTTTNAAGLYTVSSLPPSTYTLTVAASGFRTATRPGITLVVNQHATVNVGMVIGSPSQTVTVSGAAPLLEAQDATTGQTVGRELIDDLPLVGRSVYDLVYLSPGVNPAAGHAVTYGEADNNFSSNGGREDQADILVDGVSTSAPENNTTMLLTLYTPSVEAVQEFKVEQNEFSADKGYSGNTVVNVVMRSGTNQFHGDVYEYLRNNALDANNWFNNRAGIPLATSRENDFGFTFGGPIQRDKTFFFVDYEGTRTASADSYAAGVPSAAERAGDFSEICADNGGTFSSKGECSAAAGQLWDPYSAIYNSKTAKANDTATIPDNNMANYTSPGSPLLVGTPYQPAATPGNLIDPVAAKVMSYFPMPNLNVGTSAYNPYDNWAGAGATTSLLDQGDIKIDRQISDTTHFSARYSMNDHNSLPPDPWGNALWNASTGPDTYGIVSTVVQLTHNFSPTFLLNASLGYTRDAENRLGVAAEYPQFNSISALGLPSYMGDSGVDIAPAIDISTDYKAVGTYSIGEDTSSILHYNEEVYDVPVGLDKISGHHDFKFGGEMRVTKDDFSQPGEPGGKFSYSYTTTSQLSTTGSGGDAMASFLTGLATSGCYQYFIAVATQSWDYAGYLQDNWHVTPKLTLNLGLRYELPLPRTERFNRGEWLNPTILSPLSDKVSLSSSAAAVFSDAGLPVPNLSTLYGGMQFVTSSGRYVVNPDFMGGWQPRFGLAYHLTPNTAVRGGFGIFDFSTDYTSSGTGAGGFDGFSQTTSLLTTYESNGYTPFGRLSNPWPNGFVVPTGSSEGLSTELGVSAQGFLRDENAIPYDETWNLGVQHQFGSVLVDAEYVGTKGTHLYWGEGNGLDYLGPWVQSAISAQVTALNTKIANPFYGVITTPSCSICGSTLSAYELLRPHPQFSGFSSLDPPWANSIYNALQLRVEKRFSRGLEFLADYTWSKAIDDATVGGSNTDFEGGTAPAAQDPNDLELEQSISEYDIPQVVSFSYIYQLPFGRGEHWGRAWNRFTDAVLGGWQTQGFWRFDDGQPLALTLETSDSLPTYGAQRPNLVGALTKNNGSETSMVSQYFADPQVAVTPPAFTLGTASRTLGSVRAPGTQDADLSLFKNFSIRKLGENGRLQLRIETFNAFNDVQFSAPNTDVGESTFGEITSQANSPRQVQVAAKLYW